MHLLEPTMLWKKATSQASLPATPTCQWPANVSGQWPRKSRCLEFQGAPNIKCVKTAENGSYMRESLPDASLFCSSDQFMYNYISSGSYYGIDFPSAFLVTTEVFQAIKPIETWKWTNIEENIWHGLGGQEDIRGGRIPKTLDFFDFFGSHLSFWADRAGLRRPQGRNAQFSQSKAVLDYWSAALAADIAGFKQVVLDRERGRRAARLQKRTVALLPYSSGRDHSAAGSSSILMLNATFWSLRSQFDAVVLSACHQQDYEFILKFPAWRILKFDGQLCSTNSGIYLIDHALRALRGEIDNNTWDGFSYVYFTEGDVVLYMRDHDRIEKHLLSSHKLVPHRLDVFPVEADFPAELQSLLNHTPLGNTLRETSTQLVPAPLNASSCCFAGRMKSCRQKWWNCRGQQSAFRFLQSAKFSPCGLPVTLASTGGPEFCEVTARRKDGVPSCR